MLHQALLRDTRSLGSSVHPDHGLRPDRRQVGSRGPAMSQPAQIHLEDRRVIGRQSFDAG
jgi:hypothetical protein